MGVTEYSVHTRMIQRDGRENLQAGDDVLRVVRGGSFVSDQRGVRCAYRFRHGPVNRRNYVGFRVVVAPVTSGL